MRAYTTYYLRFASEAEANTKLTEVNLEGELPEALQEFIVTPQSPYRVFA